MERQLFGMPIKQNSKTEFLCVNDLVKAGNKFRMLNNLPLFDYNNWKALPSNKEFIQSIEKRYGNAIQATRGANGSTWAHPFIFIDIAMSISPELKIEVYAWLYDQLIKFRNDSGDSYKKMCGALYDNAPNKQKFPESIKKTAITIQNACKISDWQKANEEQLKLRDKIQDNISLLCDVLRDNNEAIRLGILKAKGVRGLDSI